MKVAIISDIHGNMQALESVLKDAKEQACEKIFCLGDIAMAGPQPGEAVEFVMKQSDWSVIQGNTDKLIADYSPAVFTAVKNNYPVMGDALADDILQIGEECTNFLRNLPAQMELEVEGTKILLVHGSPRVNNENIYPNLPIEKVEEMISPTDADVIFCGHTHLPCGYQTSTKQTVINVGSIGRPMHAPQASYAIADFNNGEVSFEHRSVDYDKETAVSFLNRRDFDGAREIAELLISPNQRHI